jgi:amidase
MSRVYKSRIVDMDAAELSDAIRGRQVSCREVMEAYLEQIDRVNPKVNAIVSLQDRQGLMAQAEERDRQLAGGQWLGWMHGFPRRRRISRRRREFRRRSVRRF